MKQTKCLVVPDNLSTASRSLCSVAQEITAEQLENLIPGSNQAASKKMKPTRDDPTRDDPDASEALEGLDALADLAIQEEGESLASSSQATTKHPRHRPGCTCIVCIQPPSGKGTKHKETCTCNVCLTVKRRFRTLMLRREKRQSEKEAESARQKQQVQFSEQLPDDGTQLSNDIENGSPYHKIPGDEDPGGDLNQRSSSLSPFKGQFDLNIQPERDEELSPGSDSSAFLRLIQEATDKCLLTRQTLSCLTANQSSGGNQTHLEGVGEGNLSNGIALGSAHQDTEAVRPVTLSMTELALTSPTDE